MNRKFCLAMLATVIGGNVCQAGWFDSKCKAIARGLNNAAKVTGRDLSDGYKHVTNTPIQLGTPNFGYMRGALDHKPFGNDKGVFGQTLGDKTAQELGLKVLKLDVMMIGK